MTEAEWLATTDPTAMVEFLRARVSDRKIRLFGVACCRRIWHLLTDDRSRAAVAVTERFADGLAGMDDRLSALADAEAAEDHQHDAAFPESLVEPDSWSFEVCCDASAAASAARSAASEHPIDMTAAQYRGLRLTPHPPGSHSVYRYAQQARAHVVNPLRYEDVRWADTLDRTAAKHNEAVAQTELVRDVFGNPFRPVAADPAWRTTAVVGLAEAIYEQRAFDRLPILADALEEAGCDSAEVLAHCRGPGPHVRGCWVVDLVLGKG